jgi:hypothetical protein
VINEKCELEPENVIKGRDDMNWPSKMPRLATVTDIHPRNIIACVTSAVTLLDEINDIFGPPFVQTISSTTLSLITAVQVRIPKVPMTVSHQIVECEA